jgi:hypothetical protein
VPVDHRVAVGSHEARTRTAAVIRSNYERWIGDRTVSSLGTNDGSEILPFQWWHHFKESFAPELIYQAITSHPSKVTACLDPFGGSGTTALTSRFLDIPSTTIEINPFLADVIRAKLAKYDTNELLSLFKQLPQLVKTTGRVESSEIRKLPPTFIEPGVSGRWIFNVGVAERINSYAAVFDDLANPDIQRLMRALLGGMLVAVSNVVVSGKGRRYRRDWASRGLTSDLVDTLLMKRFSQAIQETRRFSTGRLAVSTVLTGDARATQIDDSHDLAVFSPPYPNSFDYTDVYNLELWMLGYLRSAPENRTLRESTLTSHVQVARTYAPAPKGSVLLAETLERLRATDVPLWSRSIPDMVGAYFADLSLVLERVRNALNPGGRCWLVVGDSKYAGIQVRTSQIIAELIRSSGWSVCRSQPIRAMQSSAQHGGVRELSETLLVLARD